jgi:TonB family protein
MVESSSDPAQLYKGLLEYSLRSRWDRPQDMDDQNFEADVQVAVDSTGQISNPVWKKSSGDKRWDDTVRQALAKTQSVNRAPPANFPARVTIRFDVVPCEPVTP